MSADDGVAKEATEIDGMRLPTVKEWDVSTPDALVGAAGTELPLRTLVPGSELVTDAELGPRLQWAGGRARLSEDLHDVLWRFVELGDAPEADIGTFARRYGVLAGVADPETTGRPLALRGWQLLPGTEPIAAWRAVARGFAATLDLGTELALPVSLHRDQETALILASMQALLTVRWLRETNRDPPLPDVDEAATTWMLLYLNEVGPRRNAGSRLRWFVNKLLNVTQVQPLAAVARDVEDDRFSLPAVALGRLEQPPERPGASDMYWRVPALLPVLSVALARAVEPGKFARCSYCGRLARIQGRGPDPRRAWFGDHDYCRWRSRSEVMREVNQRYQARHAAQETDG